MSNIFTEPGDNNKEPINVDVKLEDLVGEGKKFADGDALAKAKAMADAFVEQLKEENKGLRDAASKSNNAEENLRVLQTKIAELEAKLNKSDEPSPNTKGELTAEKLEEIVTGVITRQEQSRTANQNLAAANSEMVKQLGSVEKAQEVFKTRAAELGMSVGDLKAIAAKSPAAFFSIMKIEAGKPGAVKSDLQTSTVNTAALPNGSGLKPGTHAYYNELRKKMGNQAFFADKKLQTEIFKAKVSGTYDSQ